MAAVHRRWPLGRQRTNRPRLLVDQHRHADGGGNGPSPELLGNRNHELLQFGRGAGVPLVLLGPLVEVVVKPAGAHEYP